MIQARIRWVPPVILCMAILVYALIPQPAAPFESMQDAYTTISWAEFITGPLAVLLLVSSVSGLVYCYFRYPDGMTNMVMWCLTAGWFMAARPFFSVFFVS